MDIPTMTLIVQTCGVVGTLLAATIGVRSYVNSNKRAEDVKKKEQETRDRELETRKLQFMISFVQNYYNVEGSRRLVDLLNMQWKDWDDFERRYGSDNNPEYTAKLTTHLNYLEMVGTMLKDKMIDPETLYNMNGVNVIFLYMKFKDYLTYEREHYFGKDLLVNFEYLGQEMLKIKLRRDPSFKVPENFISYIPEN
ncbi:MAG: hypothetical protein ABSA11_17305 [Candidatus Bathyarchaeia archaeon]